VSLERSDGTVVKIPLEKLSDADRRFVGKERPGPVERVDQHHANDFLDLKPGKNHLPRNQYRLPFV
jgi:hypothetical protein